MLFFGLWENNNVIHKNCNKAREVLKQFAQSSLQVSSEYFYTKRSTIEHEALSIEGGRLLRGSNSPLKFWKSSKTVSLRRQKYLLSECNNN